MGKNRRKQQQPALRVRGLTENSKHSNSDIKRTADEEKKRDLKMNEMDSLESNNNDNNNSIKSDIDNHFVPSNTSSKDKKVNDCVGRREEEEEASSSTDEEDKEEEEEEESSSNIMGRDEIIRRNLKNCIKEKTRRRTSEEDNERRAKDMSQKHIHDHHELENEEEEEGEEEEEEQVEKKTICCNSNNKKGDGERNVLDADESFASSYQLTDCKDMTPTSTSSSNNTENKRGRNLYQPPSSHEGISNDTTVRSNGLALSQEEDLDDHQNDANDERDKKRKRREERVGEEDKRKKTRQSEVEKDRHSHHVVVDSDHHDDHHLNDVSDVKGVTREDDGDEHQEQRKRDRRRFKESGEEEGKRDKEKKEEEDDKEEEIEGEEDESYLETRRSQRNRNISGEEKTNREERHENTEKKNITIIPASSKQRSSSSFSQREEGEEEGTEVISSAAGVDSKQTDNDVLMAISSSSTTSQLMMMNQEEEEEDDDRTEGEEEMNGDDDEEDGQKENNSKRRRNPSSGVMNGDNNNTSGSFNHVVQQQLMSPRKKFKEDTIIDRDWICPVCHENQQDQHTFTVHIRQHNPTDHSHTCSICGKTLSSASSLDRHMLIHSGERPFKCRICNMAFTTNGNMHRHMRTHGMELNDDLTPVRGRGARASRDSSGNTRFSKVNKPRIDVDESSNHSEDSGHVKSTTSLERSPGGLSDTSRRPNDTSLSMKHLMNGSGKFPFSGHASHPGSSLGFFDLSFTDFTSKKFPSIAQSFCEHNLRKSSSPFHEYECVKCQRGFPSGSSLNLHESSVHSSATFCGFCRVDLGSPDAFFKHMIEHQLQGLGIRSGADVSSLLHNNHPFSQSKDKEGFMAMLQLHTREQERLLALNLEKDAPKITTDPSSLPFDDPSYFIHAKPSPKISTNNSSDASINLTNKKSDAEIDVGKTDLADIQSIISVTKSGNHLKQMSAASPSFQSGSDEEESQDVVAKKDNEASSSSNDGQGSVTEEDVGSRKHSSFKGSSSSVTKNNDSNDLACKVCGVEFKNSSALKKHSRGHLQGGGHNYSCHLCSYTSLDKSTLVRHLRTHNGERPFQCVICKYAFTTKANCERHVRKRHKKFSKAEIKASMQFNTDLLASSSASIDSLNLNNSNLSLVGSHRHQRDQDRKDEDSSAADSSDHFPNSSDTVCKYCKVDFKFNRVLKHHLRSLNNSCNRKPYICSICTLGFSTKNNCLRHVLRQHSAVDGDKAISCILFNGKAMNASSYTGSEDFSDDDSSSHARNGSVCSKTSSMSVLKPPVVSSPSTSSLRMSQALASNNYDDRNSSLAALCSIQGVTNKPLNMSSKPENDAYDGGDEFDENNNDEQPFDLSRTSRVGRLDQNHNRTHQPLDLAAHALDLSCKQSLSPNKSGTPDKPEGILNHTSDDLKISDISARSAASTLLALQSMAASRFCPTPPKSDPKPLFPFPGLTHSMAAAFAQNPLLYHAHQAALNAQQGMIHPGMMHPSAASAVVDNLLKLSGLTAAASNGLKPPVINPLVNNLSAGHSVSTSPASVGLLTKNERHFTCKYCSAGFTLKSNMERHIKRKHPMFARATRSVRSASCGSSSGVKEGSPVEERSPDVPSNQSSSFLRKSSGSVTHSLSSTTRDALREVLNHKALSGVNDDDNEDEDFDSSEEIDVEATDLPSTSLLNKSGHIHPQTDNNLEDSKNHNISQDNSDAEESAQSSLSSNDYPSSSSKITSRDRISGDESSESQAAKTRKSAYTDSPNSVSCPYCSRKFPWSSSLRRHILTHTGAKPFKCPKCPILFTTKSNCERHLIRKHKTIGEASSQEVAVASLTPSPPPMKEDSLLSNDQFKCSICLASFSTSGNLRKHVYLCHWTTQSGSSLLRDKMALNSLPKSPSGDSAESPPSDDLTSPPPEDTDSGKSINSLLFVADNERHRVQASDQSTDSGILSSSSDLIQNLLGIQDSKILDEMLGSAASAARLLGVRDAFKASSK